MKKQHLLLILILFVGFNKIQAQQAALASGGNATGSGGSISYSIGQIDYITATGSAGSAGQGLQQPFEISTLNGDEFTQIKLEMVVYPNPTTSDVTLQIDASDELNMDAMSYQLFDMNGKIITTQKIVASETQIRLDHLSSAIYFLRVFDDNQTNKTFRIIKNN